MLTLLHTLLAFEGASLWASRYRYVMLAVFFQALLLLFAVGVPEANKETFSITGIILITALMAFQGEMWLLDGFKSAHFHHLSLVPSTAMWFIWIKIWILAGAMAFFIGINIIPWALADHMAWQPWGALILVLPYIMGLYFLVFALSRGHMQGLYVGPLLLIPLKGPVLLVCFSHNVVCCTWEGAVIGLSFVMAWAVSKVVYIQTTS